MSSTQTVRVVMQQVTKTSTEWDADENLIRRGVICVELDAAADAVVGVKVGVGDKTFANLGYVTDPQLGTAAVADVDDFDPAGTAAAAVLALVADASPAGDTLAELEARIAAVEALGSLATDAELVAAVAALIGDADVDGDTLGELQALIGARLAASANLGDVASPAAARANLDVYDTAAVDAAVAAARWPTLYNRAIDVALESCDHGHADGSTIVGEACDTGQVWAVGTNSEGDTGDAPVGEYRDDGSIHLDGPSNSTYFATLVLDGIALVSPSVRLRARSLTSHHRRRRLFIKWIDRDNWLAVDWMGVYAGAIIERVGGVETQIGNWGGASSDEGLRGGSLVELEAGTINVHSSSGGTRVWYSFAGYRQTAALTVAAAAGLSGPGTVGVGVRDGTLLYGLSVSDGGDW